MTDTFNLNSGITYRKYTKTTKITKYFGKITFSYKKAILPCISYQTLKGILLIKIQE